MHSVRIVIKVHMHFLYSKRNMRKWAVTIQWTGLLDWTTGLDYWTHGNCLWRRKEQQCIELRHPATRHVAVVVTHL